MTSPAVRRWLAAAVTACVLGACAAAVYFLRPESVDARPDDKDKPAAFKADPKDWPLFGGTVQRNLVNTLDKNVARNWDVTPMKQKNVKWEASLGSKAYGGPVVAGGKVFVGTNNYTEGGVPRNPRDVDPVTKKPADKGIVLCLDEATGKFLWQAVHDKLPGGRVNDWPGEGICSSPVVEGNRLWYVSNRCEVICADTEGFLDGKNDGVADEQYKTPTDADVIWRLDMIGKLGVFPHNLATCSPLVVGDTLFVITSNGVDENHLNIPRPLAPSFLAIDKNTGEVKWKDNSPSRTLITAREKNPNVTLKELVDRGLVLMHGQWSNPVYAEPGGKPQIIFPGGDGWVYAFNPKNGELLWKFDCNPKDSFYELGGKGTRNDFVSTPVVHDNKLYIGVGQDPEHNKGVGHLWCIDITKQPANPAKDLSPATKPGAKEGDPPQTIFDPKDAANKGSALVWHYGGVVDKKTDRRGYLFGRTLSTCAVHDGLVYAADYDGMFYCLDAKTGEKLWDEELPQDTWGSPYWVDGHVYIGNEGGVVVIFQHGRKKNVVATVEMHRNPQIRATPVVSKGVLYLMPEQPCKLYAIK